MGNVSIFDLFLAGILWIVTCSAKLTCLFGLLGAVASGDEGGVEIGVEASDAEADEVDEALVKASGAGIANTRGGRAGRFRMQDVRGFGFEMAEGIIEKVELDEVGNGAFFADGFDVEAFDVEGFDFADFTSGGFKTGGFAFEVFDDEASDAECFETAACNAEDFDGRGFESGSFEVTALDTGLDVGGFDAEDFDPESLDLEGWDAGGCRAGYGSQRSQQPHSHSRHGISVQLQETSPIQTPFAKPPTTLKQHLVERRTGKQCFKRTYPVPDARISGL